MNHLSFFWLPDNRELLISGIEGEFAQLIERSISTGKVVLPPIPEVVQKIQRLSTSDETTIADVAECLLEDPSLAAIILRVANSVIFNRRNITCTDLNTSVARLGVTRVRDIVTAQAIEQLKRSVNLSVQCNTMLKTSAGYSRELGATMVIVVKSYQEDSSEYRYLAEDKALLVGLLADIGLFCLVNEYYLYLENGNYLSEDIALQVFRALCPMASQLVLKNWGFDDDFISVATNIKSNFDDERVSYLDIARISHQLLTVRKQEDPDTRFMPTDVKASNILGKLTQLSDHDFQTQIDDIISTSGL
ncbi:HDOD domain-containing protein [Vibrio profundum]|uniref:HDOD domain-containing protein n=1 Tax=Vibrio profundum TaxID=2910247 RepID=UPI003D0D04A0